MNAANGQVSIDRIADVLECARKKGVRLWSENGQLRYKAPKGVLTREEIEDLRLSRGQIVALLEKAVGLETIEPRLEPRPRPDRAPLTFSQLAHWNFWQLHQRRSIRQVPYAIRLQGRLNVDALRKSVAQIVRRHEALRTRIVVYDGIPTQEIDESGTCELEVDDLRSVSEPLRDVEVKQRIEQLALEPIDVAVGPLFGIRLLTLRDDEHVLIMALEHIISDGFSVNILVRDIFAAYIQALKGRDFSFSEIAMQFADYAVWQRNAHNSWMKKHGAYLSERLAGSQRVRFPDDKVSNPETQLGWGSVSLQIGRDLKAELTDWCRLRRTTVVMSVFAAYVALVLRWCNVTESVFRYQSDGRFSPKIENAIGYFAAVLYLRLQLFREDTFVDVVNRATEEYCLAYEHADFSYIAAQVPRPEFTYNTTFNWLPKGSLKIDLSELDGSEHAIRWSPIRFAYPIRRNVEIDMEPLTLLSDADDGIIAEVYFPLNRFSVGLMERFSRNFQGFIEALLRQPDGRVMDVSIL